MRTRLVILLACLLGAGCAGFSSNEGGTTLPPRDAFTLTTAHVGRHHVRRLHIDCGTQAGLCRAVEVILRAPAKRLGAATARP